MAIEDISLADPRALEQCVAAMQAVHFLGIPEGDLALAQAAIYLCVAPKSDAAYRAMGAIHGGRGEDDRRAGADESAERGDAVDEGVGLRRGVPARAQLENAIPDMECLPPSLAGRQILLPYRSRRGKADRREAGGDPEIEGEEVEGAGREGRATSWYST